MQQVSPQKILVSLLSVLLIVFMLSALFPESGEISLGKIKIKFLTLNKILHPEHAIKKDEKVDSLLANIDTSSIVEIDTLAMVNKEDSLEMIKKVDERINLQVVQKIEFTDGNKKALNSFFEKLRNGSAVRILHYGDSQIEGDRMTGFLRQKLQSQFGGSGVGLVMASDLYQTNSYKLSLSPEWKRYTGFANVNKNVKHKKYGVMAAFSRFTEIVEDSLIAKQLPIEAWIEIRPSKSSYANVQTFSQAKLFYGNCKDSVLLKVFNGETEIYSALLVADFGYHELELKFETTPSSLKYVFKGKDSPDIYGFSLEGSEGIMVDNIALRGASGTFFNKLDQGLQKMMFDDLDVGVFILQFGGNVMPYMEDEKEAADYGNWLESQMRTLKKIRPDACIIVIGPADMSTKVGETFATYPLLPNVIASMKEAAFNAGAVYWDMYGAMGGENSMLSWVDKKLAGDDYTHFSPAGAKYIIQMFYEALMFEYYEFLDAKESKPVK